MQYDQTMEDTTMKYSKPEITMLASALEAVQSHGVKVQAVIADSPYELEATPSAYEADE